jgi:mannosyltransferase OCH1-like enzyme
LVPKIVHLVRLGSRPYAPNHSATVRALNPDWEVMEWTDDNVGQLEELPRDLFDRAPELAAKADLLRLAALLKFGGVYSDLDVEWKVPLPDIVPLDGRFVCVMEENDPPVPNNAVMAAPPGNAVTRALLDEARSRAEVKLVPARWGPGLLLKVLPSFGKQVRTLPSDVAPNPSRAWTLRAQGITTPAVHHYGASWWG